MKFTPGPWEVATKPSFTSLMKGAQAEVYTRRGQDGGPQAIGQFYLVEDAQKAAAAPDLLEACKAASSALSWQYSMDGQFSRWQDEALYVMLNNAIRKATE
jgi:hypothetical protein